MTSLLILLCLAVALAIGMSVISTILSVVLLTRKDTHSVDTAEEQPVPVLYDEEKIEAEREKLRRALRAREHSPLTNMLTDVKMGTRSGLLVDPDPPPNGITSYRT